MVQTFEWIDPLGVHTALNATWDFDGRYMPPVEFVTDKNIGTPGETVRHVRHGARPHRMTVYLDRMCDGSLAQLQQLTRDLVYAMDPTRGFGYIRTTRADGQQRDLKCMYASGLELPEKFGSTSTTRLQKATITFIAHDPYWTGTSPQVLAYQAAEGQNFFPFFPFHLSTSQIVTTAFIPNPGTQPSWPIWKIMGPGGTIILQNTDTGQWLNFANNGGLVLPAGEAVNVDTSFGVKSVTRESDGANLFSYLTNDSVLWPIPPGGANMMLMMTGVTPGQSTLQLTFTSRYTTV